MINKQFLFLKFLISFDYILYKLNIILYISIFYISILLKFAPKSDLVNRPSLGLQHMQNYQQKKKLISNCAANSESKI